MNEVVETVVANPTWPIGMIFIVAIGVAAYMLMRKKKSTNTGGGGGGGGKGGPPVQRK